MRGDLVLGLPWPPGLFDRIVAHMVLMDIPVLDRLLADVAAALRPGGVFVFTILHPAWWRSRAPARLRSQPATNPCRST
jgi:SAM-dependent methyltransferase